MLRRATGGGWFGGCAPKVADAPGGNQTAGLAIAEIAAICPPPCPLLTAVGGSIEQQTV